MLYFLIRPIVRIGLRLIYRKIDIANIDRIPKDKAVILAANHPTAFIEPCILACYLDRPLHFLARGDLFSKPLFIRILRALHILPVYRLRDGGYSKLKRNYETFAECHRALSQQKTIMVLAEGRCIHEKKLRPLRKGTARIALGALTEDDQLAEVYIVPVGVNFTYADRARSSVMITFNEPIAASEYLAGYQEQASQAITELTDALRDRLMEDVIHIPDTQDELPAEYLFRLARTQQYRPVFPLVTHTETQLRTEKRIADEFVRLPTAEKQTLRDQLSQYFGRLDWADINDAALAGKYKKDKAQLGPFVWLLLGIPILIWHLPPFFLGQVVADTKVKEMEFYLPVKATVWIVAYAVYNLLWMLYGLMTGHYWWILLAPLLTLAGFFLLLQKEQVQRWLLAWKTWRQTPQELELLREKRTALITQMKEYQWL